jgi:hypothetical protein
LPEDLERASKPAFGDLEALRLGIDVVKVQGADAPVVPAEQASPAGLCDENLLRPPSPSSDALRCAERAAEAT